MPHIMHLGQMADSFAKPVPARRLTWSGGFPFTNQQKKGVPLVPQNLHKRFLLGRMSIWFFSFLQVFPMLASIVGGSNCPSLSAFVFSSACSGFNLQSTFIFTHIHICIGENDRNRISSRVVRDTALQSGRCVRNSFSFHLTGWTELGPFKIGAVTILVRIRSPQNGQGARKKIEEFCGYPQNLKPSTNLTLWFLFSWSKLCFRPGLQKVNR